MKKIIGRFSRKEPQFVPKRTNKINFMLKVVKQNRNIRKESQFDELMFHQLIIFYDFFSVFFGAITFLWVLLCLAHFSNERLIFCISFGDLNWLETFRENQLAQFEFHEKDFENFLLNNSLIYSLPLFNYSRPFKTLLNILRNTKISQPFLDQKLSAGKF